MIVEPSTAASATIAQADAPQICRLLEAHGAVLLRGWAIQDSEAFASAISALCKGSNLRSLDDYCPAEHGRDHPRTAINSSTTIWPTNRLRTTGGYLQMDVVPHTECFYALNQPRVCAFYCQRSSWLGGETALFDGSAALNALPPRLRSKLGKETSVRRVHSLSRLRERHGEAILEHLPGMTAGAGATWQLLDDRLGHDALVALTLRRTVASTVPPPPLISPPPRQQSGPRGEDSDGDRAYNDKNSGDGSQPSTSLGILHVRFNFGELSYLTGARHALLRGLLRRGLFAGRKWAMHRWLWKLALCRPDGIVGALLSAFDSIPGWLSSPRSMLRAVLDERRVAAARARVERSRRGQSSRRKKAKDNAALRTLTELLSEHEAEQLADSLAEHVSAVRWQSGDVLLVDNTRILHDGLPGFGPFRKLHVALLTQVNRRVCASEVVE